MESKKSSSLPPRIFNVFKPPRFGSFDVVRHFKKNIAVPYGKIGHFGTLDPFACGVLMIGVGGAARLNDLIHQHWPKTYLAVGKLGVETDTGDWQGAVKQLDQSRYSTEVIAGFDSAFIEQTLQQRFLGEYWQAPPAFSAAKFQGKPLHAWTREGVVIQKEAVKREVMALAVQRWSYPFLALRVTVSSGTYIRTLFQEAARALGTIGSLVALQRESVGEVKSSKALHLSDWPSLQDSYQSLIDKSLAPEDVLPYPRWEIPLVREKAFQNGLAMRCDEMSSHYAWAIGGDGRNWGLLERKDEEWRVAINFRAMLLAGHVP